MVRMEWAGRPHHRKLKHQRRQHGIINVVARSSRYIEPRDSWHEKPWTQFEDRYRQLEFSVCYFATVIFGARDGAQTLITSSIL